MPRNDGSTKTSEPGITRHTQPSGTVYRVRVSHTNPATHERQRITETFPTLKQARDWKTKTLHELRAGIYQAPCLDPVALTGRGEEVLIADRLPRGEEPPVLDVGGGQRGRVVDSGGSDGDHAGDSRTDEFRSRRSSNR